MINTTLIESHGHVLAGLHALLTLKEVTDREFRQILQTYPELLSEQAQTIGELVATSQGTEKAKAIVVAVLGLLRRCMTSGINVGLFEHRLEMGRQSRNERMAELQRSFEAKRKAYLPQGIQKQTDLPSLGECTEHLRRSYPETMVARQAKSVECPSEREHVEVRLPRYLFRGEAGSFPQSTSSLDRLRMRTDLPFKAVEDILRCKIRIQAWLIQHWKVSPMLAEGFLQHYGMPTSYLDMASKLDVALSFASDLKVGEIGRICVMPLDLLEQNGQVIDLTRHPFADRPARQHALAWASDRHRDLKAPDTLTALGLKWYAFEFTEQDINGFGPDPLLLDAHSDRAAGLIELAMHGMGKIHDAAAQWISKRLQPAPFMLLRAPGTEGEGISCAWVSADEAGVPYRENENRRLNYERWSDAFPAIERKELPPGIGSSAKNIPIGATLTVLTSDLFGILSPTGKRFVRQDRPDSAPESG